MFTDLIKKGFRASLDASLTSEMSAWGLLLLRGVTGGLIFYIHGWHKLEGGVAYLREGTPWQLLTEVAAMHFPAPLASAFAATAIQFVCAPLLALGLYTRLNAAALTTVLGVAILQNLRTHRDPQLTVIYVLVVVAFVLIGGGPLSLDAKINRSIRPKL